jgi:hypothetical protein
MQRLRVPIVLTLLCLGLWLMAVPALAAPGQNGGQNGQNCPSGQGCPGGPTLSESPHPITLLLAGIAVLAVCLCVVALRRRARPRVAA